MNTTLLFPDGYSVCRADKNPTCYNDILGMELPFFDLYGGVVENKATMKICLFDAYLVAAFRCEYRKKPVDVSPLYGNRVFRGECVELFVGSKEEYFELDVSPFGPHFFALISSDGKSEQCADLDVATHSVWGEDYYEVMYRIPIALLSKWERLYFNAFRVEGVYHEERFSRAVFKTDCLLHHVPASFQRLKWNV